MWLRQFNGVNITDHICIEVSDEQANAIIDFAGAQWKLTTQLKALNSQPGAMEGNFCAEVLSGNALQVNAAIEFRDDEWSEDNFVMIPTAAYNGNRFKSRRMDYAPLSCEPEDMQVNPQPVMVMT